MFFKYLIHFKDRKGVALVSALGLSLVVLVASVALIYRLTNFVQGLRYQQQKDQTYYTAYSGIEEIRDYFWDPTLASSCIPPFWCGLLGQDLRTTHGDFPNIPEYSNITLDVTGSANPELIVGTGSPVSTNTFYTLHLMDNHDEPSISLDYTFDNDEVVLVLATATGVNETRTSIEANIIYDGGDASGIKQKLQGPGKESNTLEQDVVFTARQVF